MKRRLFILSAIGAFGWWALRQIPRMSLLVALLVCAALGAGVGGIVWLITHRPRTTEEQVRQAVAQAQRTATTDVSWTATHVIERDRVILILVFTHPNSQVAAFDEVRCFVRTPSGGTVVGSLMMNSVGSTGTDVRLTFPTDFRMTNPPAGRYRVEWWIASEAVVTQDVIARDEFQIGTSWQIPS